MTSPDNAPPPDKTGALLVRDASGRFRKGQSGNPRGAPRGSRHWATRMAEALIDGEGDAIVRVVIQKALAGDESALRLCLERLLPPRKSRPVRFDLPRIVDSASLLAAHAELLKAMADGELTPDEAAQASTLLKQHREMFQLTEVADRLAAIERVLAAAPGA